MSAAKGSGREKLREQINEIKIIHNKYDARIKATEKEIERLDKEAENFRERVSVHINMMSQYHLQRVENRLVKFQYRMIIAAILILVSQQIPVYQWVVNVLGRFIP